MAVRPNGCSLPDRRDERVDLRPVKLAIRMTRIYAKSHTAPRVREIVEDCLACTNLRIKSPPILCWSMFRSVKRYRPVRVSADSCVVVPSGGELYRGSRARTEHAHVKCGWTMNPVPCQS